MYMEDTVLVQLQYSDVMMDIHCTGAQLKGDVCLLVIGRMVLHNADKVI